MSWMPTTAPVRITSRHASSKSFSVNGSPTCTVGRRYLKRLDERRMVVALDLEDHRPAVTDVDRARILAGPLEHVRAALRQARQEHARMLVGAVLGPERREETQLGIGGLAPEAGE